VPHWLRCTDPDGPSQSARRPRQGLTNDINELPTSTSCDDAGDDRLL